jgi:hypothetical protein
VAQGEGPEFKPQYHTHKKIVIRAAVCRMDLKALRVEAGKRHTKGQQRLYEVERTEQI